MSDVKVLEKEYPCLAAVNRCANSRMFYYLSQITAAFHIDFHNCCFFPQYVCHVVVFYSFRCTSSPGQSYQAAVLWRGSNPKDTHVGGKGEESFVFMLLSLMVPYLRG